LDGESWPALLKAREVALTRELEQCNDLSERYGLRLSGAQIHTLLEARATALADTSRVEFGESVLPRLIYAFCDSPLISRDEYCTTLTELITLFYAFQNDFNDAFSDDELIDAMHKLFNGRAQGSLEYLENATVGDLFQALNDGNEEIDDDGE